jgi:hypothetical protein
MWLAQGRRVNEAAHCRDPVGWDTCAPRMLPNAVFIRREVNAIDLILGHVTVEPLNLRPHSTQNLQRAQGHLPDLHV